MGSTMEHCVSSTGFSPCVSSVQNNLIINIYRYLVRLPIMHLVNTIYMKLRFAHRDIGLYLPSKWCPMILDNLTHVLIDCDYYALKTHIPRNNHRVLDIGASIGFYTLASAVLAEQGGFVYAIEPNPYALRYLLMNIRHNSIKNTRVYPVAICDFTGPAKLYIGEYGVVSSIIRDHVERYTEILGIVDVKCIKLSDLLIILSNLDIVKIDVEGLELSILREAVNELRRVRSIVVEVHEDITDPGEVDIVLRKAGFKEIIHYVSSEMPDQGLIYATRGPVNPNYI